MAKKLERIEATDKSVLTLGTEQLLLDGNKDEIFRRAYNKYVEKQNKA